MTLSHYYFVAASCLTTLVNAENPEMDFGSDVGFGKTSTLGTNLDLGTEPTHRNLHSAVDAEEEIVEANLPLVNAKIYEMDFGSEVGFGEASTLRTNLDLGTKPTQSNLRTVLNPGEEIIETELPLHRYLQQGSTLEIWNTCDHDAYVYVIFRRGQSLFQWKWPRINMDESLSIEGVEGSSFWIYGVDGDDYSIPVWFSSDSEYCFSVGDCFREVNIDAGQDMINYLTCGAEASVPDPTRPPTLPPTQAAQQWPTRFPTRPPTLAPEGSRPPTRFPTRAPTRIPTQVTVPTQTPGIAAAPPRPANSIQQQWLNEHNSRRQAFYDLFPEYNLSPAPLKWSNSIAQSAQNYANQLIALNGCSIQHGLNDDNYGGENLASNWGSGSYAVARSPTQVLRAWYDDEIDLNRMQLVGQKYHATQAIWRSSRYLGCAQASKSTGGSAMCFIQVCRYIKPGNCLFTGSSSLYPDNCLQRYPSERNWICSVLSDTVSNSCASANEQCPAEGCF